LDESGRVIKHHVVIGVLDLYPAAVRQVTYQAIDFLVGEHGRVLRADNEGGAGNLPQEGSAVDGLTKEGFAVEFSGPLAIRPLGEGKRGEVAQFFCRDVSLAREELKPADRLDKGVEFLGRFFPEFAQELHRRLGVGRISIYQD
jgi:hypothetical protein